MSREIKYKAWNGEEISKPCAVFSDNSFIFTNSENVFVNDADIQGLKVMECTPYTDNDNNEIYEDYIVQYSTWSKRNIVRKVEFSEQMGWLPFNDWDHIQDEQGDPIKENTIKILGNIHENPELLKKEYVYSKKVIKRTIY